MSEVGGTSQGLSSPAPAPLPQATGAAEEVSGRCRWYAGRVGIGTLRWLLVAVLVVAGARKLIDAPAFVELLRSTGFFEPSLTPGLGWGVPLLELAAAVCLAVPRFQFPGIVMSLFLFATFTGLHGYLYFNGIVVPCGCTGVRETLAGQVSHLVMAVFCLGALLATGLLSFFPERRRRSSSP